MAIGDKKVTRRGAKNAPVVSTWKTRAEESAARKQEYAAANSTGEQYEHQFTGTVENYLGEMGLDMDPTLNSAGTALNLRKEGKYYDTLPFTKPLRKYLAAHPMTEDILAEFLIDLQVSELEDEETGEFYFMICAPQKKGLDMAGARERKILRSKAAQASIIGMDITP